MADSRLHVCFAFARDEIWYLFVFSTLISIRYSFDWLGWRWSTHALIWPRHRHRDTNATKNLGWHWANGLQTPWKRFYHHFDSLLLFPAGFPLTGQTRSSAILKLKATGHWSPPTQSGVTAAVTAASVAVATCTHVAPRGRVWCLQSTESVCHRVGEKSRTNQHRINSSEWDQKVQKVQKVQDQTWPPAQAQSFDSILL